MQSSIINITFMSSIFILSLWYITKTNTLIDKTWVKFNSIFVIAMAIRLFIPLELGFTKTFASKNVLTAIYTILDIEIFNIGNHHLYLKNILFIIWIVGSIIYFVRDIIVYIKFQKNLNNFPKIKDPKIISVFKDVLEQFNISDYIELVEVDIISTPALFGIKNPVIILPTNNFSKDDLYYIFSHEIIHYQNKHLLIKLIIEILCGIYWWNPFIYILKRTVNKLLELYVDLIVMENLSDTDKFSYLECLLTIAKNRSYNKSNDFILTTFSQNKSFLSHRFKVIMDSYLLRESKISRKITYSFLPLIISLILSFSIIFEPYFIDPQIESETFEITVDNAYLVRTPEGEYDLYVNQQFKGNVKNNESIPVELKIYNSLKEVE